MSESEVLTSTAHQHLPMDAAEALFQGKVQGLVATCYVNERPLQGLAGLLDWRFHGLISHYLRAGAISGQLGECVYIPTVRHGRLFHLILLGGGMTYQPGHRIPFHGEAVQILKKNLLSLKRNDLGISRKDFGDVPMEFFTETFAEVPLWITH